MNKKKFKIILYTICLICSIIFFDVIVRTRGLFIYIVMTCTVAGGIVYEVMNKK